MSILLLHAGLSGSSSLRTSNVVIIGDMNFHNLGETDMVYDNELEDVWLNLRGLSDKGYTWDPSLNPFIRLILPFDNRRMRLDRILIHRASKNLDFTEIDMFGMKPIGVNRLFCYPVYPSDHFGLRSVFVFRSDHNTYNDGTDHSKHRPFDYYSNRMEILDGNHPHSTGFATVKIIIVKRVFMAIFLALGVLGGVGSLIWWFLSFLKRHPE
jgi:hypothetical protein